MPGLPLRSEGVGEMSGQPPKTAPGLTEFWKHEDFAKYTGPDMNRPDSTDAEKISQLLPSLPMDFWESHKHYIDEMYYDNSSCAPFPNIYNLKFNNLFWQTFKRSNVTFQLYKAFYDTRRINDQRHSVHILSMVNTVELSFDTHCHFWFENTDEPVITTTNTYRYLWYREWGDPEPGGYVPFMITCELPETYQEEVPSCVSLVEKPCDTASNLLSVVYEVPEEKGEFAVCVKGLDFLTTDVSANLVEWLEILNLMGASKVFFYQLQVHPNIAKVLDYYKSLGRIHVTPMTLCGEQPNLPILQHAYLENYNIHQSFSEIVPNNDCFYTNIYSYKYVALLDVDEFILPVRDSNWTTLMKRVIRKAGEDQYASYNARNVYFLEELNPVNPYSGIPPYMHFLSQTYRSSLFTPPLEYVKSFFDTETVLTVHNHLPIHIANHLDSTYSMSRLDAQLSHYRKGCAQELDCLEYSTNITEDIKLWKHKDVLISRVSDVLKSLNII